MHLLGLVGRVFPVRRQTAEIEIEVGVAACGEIGQVERYRERFGIDLGQLCPLPDIGLGTDFLLRLVKPDHHPVFFQMDDPLQLCCAVAARARVINARMAAVGGAQQIDVVDAEVIVETFRTTQVMANPLDPAARPEHTLVVGQNAQRHVTITVAEQQLIGAAVGQFGLLGDHARIVERIDAFVFDLDMQGTRAGERQWCGQQQTGAGTPAQQRMVQDEAPAARCAIASNQPARLARRPRSRNQNTPYSSPATHA